MFLSIHLGTRAAQSVKGRQTKKRLTELPQTLKGQLDDSVPLPRALARGLAAQKHSGLQLAKVEMGRSRLSYGLKG